MKKINNPAFTARLFLFGIYGIPIIIYFFLHLTVLNGKGSGDFQSILSILIKSVSITFIWIIISKMFFIAHNKYKFISFILFFITTFTYNLSIFAQLISLYTLYDYIPLVGFDNFNDIHFVLEEKYVFFMAFWLISLLFISFYIYKHLKPKPAFKNKWIGICVALFLIFIFNLETMNPNETLTPLEAYAQVIYQKYEYKNQIDNINYGGGGEFYKKRNLFFQPFIEYRKQKAEYYYFISRWRSGAFNSSLFRCLDERRKFKQKYKNNLSQFNAEYR